MVTCILGFKVDIFEIQDLFKVSQPVLVLVS